METVIPKSELLRIIKAFVSDKRRGISIQLFADVCGIDRSQIYEVFVHEQYPMSELVQRKVSRGYSAWRDGYIAVMEQYGKKWFEWRKEPKVRMVRSQSLQVRNGQIVLNVGIRNRLDYVGSSLDEQLKGK
jgi:hypothetical protein